jgi:antirestriction protein
MTTTEPRAWVGCLAACNAGILHGEWLDCDDEDTFNEGLKRILDNSPIKDAEELLVMDHEGLPIKNGCSPQEALRLGLIVDAVVNVGGWPFEIIEHAIDHVGDDLKSITIYITQRWQGTYKDRSDFAYEFHESIGTEIPEHLQYYIDWDAMGRDMLMCDFYDVDLRSGGIAVMRNT